MRKKRICGFARDINSWLKHRSILRGGIILVILKINILGVYFKYLKGDESDMLYFVTNFYFRIP